MLKLIFVVLLLSGCVSTSSGNLIDQAQVKGFKEGVTTEADVVQALGTPLSVKDASDGNRTLMYYHSETQARGIIGLGGNVNMDMVVITLLFGNDGKLLSHETTKSKYTN